VTSLEHLDRLAAAGASGAIVGRALQEGRLDPTQVLPGYSDARRDG
jgi:phosphoribosylformimino-5-aminoimidazole carboxamide ribonucleotide (ProFAR) isomerase